MNQTKIKIKALKVKSFITSTTKATRSKATKHDGGYTWVG